jgi:hypothetical protein
MNRKLRFVLATLLCTMCVGLVSGQEEAPKPELAYVLVEHVKPSMSEQYEAATKELIGELAAHEADPTKTSFMAVSGSEIGYVYVVSLENYAAMDTLGKIWHAEIEKVGEEKWHELEAKADKAVEYRESFHVARRPELSYVPENPRLKQGDIKYIRYTFLYVIPGQEKQFEKVAAEFVALYKSKDVESGWSMYQPVTGTDLPVYIVASGAKGPADYFAQGEKIDTLLGDEGEQLGQKGMSCVRKVEHKAGRPRPDLSYPTTKAETEDE